MNPLKREDINLPNENNNYICEKCNFYCNKKNDWNRHIKTKKHNNNLIVKKTNKPYECNCGKGYIHSQSLWKHRKICQYILIEKEDNEENNFKPTYEVPIINTNMIIELIKENQEIKKILIEQNKQLLQHNKEVSEQNKQVLDQNKQNSILINKIVEKDLVTNNTQNITNNNTINQKFNLNIFLNETCKDAMNMKEFIDNIKITFEQLLNIGDTGFVSGVSDIFVKQLRNLDITKRPIHCTDVKRETIYLKEENKWDKDDKENTKLKSAIERVEYRNISALHQWCQENPESKINNSKLNLLKDKIYLETLQGDEKTRDKIIKNISKEITIDKNESII